jgi:hypothetical protein
MELQEAMELFEEIVELCYETENPRIIEVIEEIYSEVEYSTSVPKVILALEELQVVINQQDLTEDEEEITNEIQEKIELMSE